MVIMPYKLGSQSAKALAQELNLRRVRPDGDFRNNFNHTILNWGCSVLPTFPINNVLNTPSAVRCAANKLSCFEQLGRHDIPIPKFSTHRDEISEWVSDNGTSPSVVCRRILNGHSGRGIVLARDISELVDAPLYVEYIKKQDEYRYHVFNGTVIDVQQKRKRREIDNDEVNYQVRNHHTGWVYCRDGINPDESLPSIAISAVQALGLHFGAVDIIWNNHRQQGYVLEVNTACGLEGTTLDKYVEAIRGVM